MASHVKINVKFVYSVHAFSLQALVYRHVNLAQALALVYRHATETKEKNILT